jgi:hypothetical protein
MTTFTNTFHATETTTRANVGETVTRATYLRIVRALCGVSGCTCGAFRGSEYRLEPTDSTESSYTVVRSR